MEALRIDIELINGADLALVRTGVIGDDDVKRLAVTAEICENIQALIITETIQGQLQLPVIDKRKAELRGGNIVECDVVGPVEIIWNNRASSCSAIVLPGDTTVMINKTQAQMLKLNTVRLPAINPV